MICPLEGLAAKLFQGGSCTILQTENVANALHCGKTPAYKQPGLRGTVGCFEQEAAIFVFGLGLGISSGAFGRDVFHLSTTSRQIKPMSLHDRHGTLMAGILVTEVFHREGL